MRSLLCETAHSAIKTRCQFKGQYQKLVVTRGKKRALVAVAHKQLEVIFVILDKAEPYRDREVDYQKLSVEKNAPRWIKALKQYGFLSS